MPNSSKNEPSLAFGGQALIEGIMMRSRRYMVSCIRKPNQEIVTDIKHINPYSERNRLFGLPFFRGIVNMIENLYLGIQGIMFSASAAFEEEAVDGKEPEKIEFGIGEIALIIGGVLGITAVFFLAPFLLATWFNLSGFLFNLAEAIIRLTMFVAYLSVISLWGQYKRVLMYHGAEHKAINAHEAGVPMDVEHVKKHSRLHPRCGTSFLFIVLIISIVVFTLMPDLGFAINLSYRLLLIPVIAGISYELLRLSGKYRNSPIVKALVSPGMAFQYLTTKEPTDDMLEVSIKAVKEVNKLICTPLHENS
ncbi:MAG: DUF1385 domain-containing protein [Candidatus Bathyarchaeota archaeon]|nr:DUF1385 domain-containing protein [Candidatus Bathyarchaeota archaeon]